MNPRWVVGGVAAAFVLFFWSFVSHMVLALEEKYIRGLPEPAAAALEANLKEPGMYYFPNVQDPAKMAEITATKPFGIMSYSVGVPFSFPVSLATQLGLYLICTLMAAWLYAKALPNLRTPGERVAFVALLGVLAAVLIIGGYANWYRFPWPLVAIGVLDQGVGWALAGLVFQRLIR
jgi:hypothetical protein